MFRQGDEFKLESWHNGLSYELTHLKSNTSTFVQGDDASRFDDEWNQAETAFPDKTFDEIASWLWDQCEYGSISQPCT